MRKTRKIQKTDFDKFRNEVVAKGTLVRAD